MPTATRIGEEETKGEATPKVKTGIAKKIVAISMVGIIAAAAVSGLTLGIINSVRLKKEGATKVETNDPTLDEDQKPGENQGTNPGGNEQEEEKTIHDYVVMDTELTSEQKVTLASKMFAKNSYILENIDAEKIDVLGTSETDAYKFAYIALERPMKSGDVVDVMYKIAYEQETDISNLAEAPIATANGTILMDEYKKLESYVAETDYDNAVTYIANAEDVDALEQVYVKPFSQTENGMTTQHVCYVALTTVDGKNYVIDNEISLEPVASTDKIKDFAEVIKVATAPKEVVVEKVDANEKTLG